MNFEKPTVNNNEEPKEEALNQEKEAVMSSYNDGSKAYEVGEITLIEDKVVINDKLKTMFKETLMQQPLSEEEIAKRAAQDGNEIVS